MDQILNHLRARLGRAHRGRQLFVAVSVIALLGVYLVLPAQAVHDVGVFELDADQPGAAPAVTDNATAGLPDDWDRVCKSATGGALCSSADAANTAGTNLSFTNDGSLNATIYTGGGSKDPQDVPNWDSKTETGGLPAKDNLLHGYAARYTGVGSPSGDYMFFGADRYDNSGDSQIGFWFFRSRVSVNADGTFNGTHTAGTVPHSAGTPGDILVLSDFTRGGTQPTVRVFEWVGSGGSAGSLNQIAGGTIASADCATSPPGDAFCASVNGADGANSPWPFTDKSGDNSFGHGEFYEGGINLSTLVLQNECFSTFLVETRSSQSVTATLKDFILGQFQTCQTTMTTTPSVGAGGTVHPGAQVTDTATIIGTGAQNPPTPTGDVTFFICGPIASGTCNNGGTQVGAPVTLSGAGQPSGAAAATSDPVDTTGMADGRYCFRAEWPGDENYQTALTHSGTGDSECFYIARHTTNPPPTTPPPSQVPHVPSGAPQTGGGSTAGLQNVGLFVLGGALLAAAAGAFAIRRRADRLW
ncbi:MAG: Ig-like domain-containing protein [Actinomycetota bacterium]|nr:Ig-like domain-containing protein [Actinomycetota bacterium]